VATVGVPAAAAVGAAGVNMPMDIGTLRSLLLEAMRRKPKTAFGEVWRLALQLAADRGLGPLSLTDRDRLLELVWMLVAQGVILPCWDDANRFPYMRLTEHGQACLDAGDILPYDPDGYLVQLKRRIPNLDDLILMYVEESLQCLLGGGYIASTVMLGVAAERAFDLLLEALIGYLSPQSGTSLRKATEGRPVGQQFAEFEKRLTGVRSELPGPLQENLGVQLTGIFTLVRTYRNDAGHPTGRRITREEGHANLIVFVPYLERVYGLIEFFREKRSPESHEPA